MKKQGTNSTEIKIPEPKTYELNGEKFSYHSISHDNFFKFPEIFSSVLQEDVSTPFLTVKTLFATGKAYDLIQLILQDENGIPPTTEKLKLVSPLLNVTILTDFFVLEGNSLLNGIFALVKSMQ
jgi:hypothetical protein